MCFVYNRFFWVWWCDRNGQMKLRWMVRMCMWCVSLLLVKRAVTRRSFFLIPFSTHSTISKTDKDNIFLFSLTFVIYLRLATTETKTSSETTFFCYVYSRAHFIWLYWLCPSTWFGPVSNVFLRLFGFFPVSFYICSHFNLFKVWEKRIPILATATSTN